jgi:hypothetical protein
MEVQTQPQNKTKKIILAHCMGGAGVFFVLFSFYLLKESHPFAALVEFFFGYINIRQAIFFIKSIK